MRSAPAAEAAAVAAKDDGARAALCGGVERLDQLITQLGIDRVVALRPVENQGEHVAVEGRVQTHAADGSLGSPRMLSPRMLRCTCEVPAYTVPLAALSIHTCSQDAVEFGVPGSSVR